MNKYYEIFRKNFPFIVRDERESLEIINNTENKIIEAIIAAYGDSNKINFDDNIIDVLLKIGMLLRITYRKSDKKVKEETNNWVKELEKQNYYDNFYLEDLILSLK